MTDNPGPPAIRLIPIGADLGSELRSTDAFGLRYRADIGGHEEAVRAVVKQTLDMYVRVHPVPPWIGYLTVDVETRLVVGTCAFTSSPTADGCVEIAYHTFPAYEHRGFAKAMARELVAICRRAGSVRTVLANTLPERNASTRVLESAGFHHAAELIHPEDGRVWQWRLELHAAAAE